MPNTAGSIGMDVASRITGCPKGRSRAENVLKASALMATGCLLPSTPRQLRCGCATSLPCRRYAGPGCSSSPSRRIGSAGGTALTCRQLRTRIHSPYDTDASFGDKRTTTWIGYKAHVTETCDADAPHVITHVVTTPAPVPDTAVTAPLHAALAGKSLLPRTHFIDAGYVDADLLLDIGAEHEVELISPIRPDASWQAKAGQGSDISAFRIDWDAQVVTCPQGHKSINGLPGVDDGGPQRVQAVFAARVCRACPSRSLCTRAKVAPRRLTFRLEERHEAIQRARRHQQTPQWRALYGVRAGIEGCLSQAMRLCGLRRSRYVGLAKAHLQHVASAAALTVVRLNAWLQGRPGATTRRSRLVRLMAA